MLHTELSHWQTNKTKKEFKYQVITSFITSILSLYRRSKVGIPCSEYSCSEINVWMTECCTVTQMSGSLSPKSRFVSCMSEFQRFTAEICLFFCFNSPNKLARYKLCLLWLQCLLWLGCLAVVPGESISYTLWWGRIIDREEKALPSTRRLLFVTVWSDLLWYNAWQQEDNAHRL